MIGFVKVLTEKLVIVEEVDMFEVVQMLEGIC